MTTVVIKKRLPAHVKPNANTTLLRILATSAYKGY